jgi:O-antigen/teichoic acid export membrane protein
VLQAMTFNRLKPYSSHLYTGIAFACFGATRFGFNILVQWVMGSETVGYYNIVLSAALMIPLFITPMFGLSMTKFASEARGRNDREEFLFVVGFNYWALIVVGIITAVVFSLSIGYMSAHFNMPERLFNWAPLIILLTCVYLYFKRLFFVLEKVKLYAVLEIVSAVVFFISLYICLDRGYRHYLLIPFVLQLGVFCLAAQVYFVKEVWQLHWMRHFKSYKDRLGTMSKYAGITGIGTALTSISLHFFTLILGGVADMKSVGHFSLIRATVEPGNYLFRIITMINLPKMAYMYGKKEYLKLTKYTRENMKHFGWVISPIFLLAASISPVIAGVLFKEGHTNGQTLLLAFLILRLFSRTLGVFHVNFLSATRYPHIPNLIGPLSVFIVVPFIPIVFTNYRLAGLGALILAGELLRVSLVTVWGEKKMSELTNERLAENIGKKG